MGALRCPTRHVAAASGGFVQRPQRRPSTLPICAPLRQCRVSRELRRIAPELVRQSATSTVPHVRMGARLTIRTSRKRAANDSADAGGRKRRCAAGSVAAQMSVHVADIPSAKNARTAGDALAVGCRAIRDDLGAADVGVRARLLIGARWNCLGERDRAAQRQHDRTHERNYAADHLFSLNSSGGENSRRLNCVDVQLSACGGRDARRRVAAQ
jgi:hypothetical protein